MKRTAIYTTAWKHVRNSFFVTGYDTFSPDVRIYETVILAYHIQRGSKQEQ